MMNKTMIMMIIMILTLVSATYAQDTEAEIEIVAGRDLNADISLEAGRDLTVNLDADNINVGGEVTLNDYSDNSVHNGGFGINDLNELIYSFLTRGKTSSQHIQDFIYLLGNIFIYRTEYIILVDDHLEVSDRLDYVQARQNMILNQSGITLDEEEVVMRKCLIKSKRLGQVVTQDGITCNAQG